MLPTRSIITIGTVTLALAVPGTSAATPITPDARDAAAQAVQQPTTREPFSPDARDAALGLSPARSTPLVQPSVEASGGFDWGDAAIGAAGMLGLALGGVGIGALAVQHQRRRDRLPIATR